MNNDDKNKKVEKKSSFLKTLFYIIFLPLLVFAVVTYVGNVLVISEKVSSIFVESIAAWVEISLNVVLIFLPVLAIAWQFKNNFFKYKTFSLDKVLDENADNAVRKKFVSSMNNDCPFKATLEAACNGSGDDLRSEIEKYRKKAQSALEEKIYETADLAVISVVASQQSFGDAISMLVWSCRVINQVLSIYGFRPHGVALLKLYFNVIFSSLLIGSIEEALDNSFIGQKLPWVGGFIQGASAMFSIFKAAYLTEYYLQHGMDANHDAARREAAKRALHCLSKAPVKKEFWKSKGKLVLKLGRLIWNVGENVFCRSDKKTMLNERDTNGNKSLKN